MRSQLALSHLCGEELSIVWGHKYVWLRLRHMVEIVRGISVWSIAGVEETDCEILRLFEKVSPADDCRRVGLRGNGVRVSTPTNNPFMS